MQFSQCRIPQATLLLLAAALPSLPADWNPTLAATYLDARQKDWAVWPRANVPGGQCVSCHTGSTYLMARPALRRILGETQPTTYETALLASLTTRVDKTDVKDVSPRHPHEPTASQAMGVESIHAALFFASRDRERNNAWSNESRLAFQRLWSLQLTAGPDKGAWAWFSLGLDPWEMPHSAYYGATLAAMAVAATPPDYQANPENRPHIQALADYLRREEPRQSLHNRLMLLWASTRLPDLMPAPRRKLLLREIARLQQPDGGWTVASLGPWKEHPTAAPPSGSDSYATALTTYTLLKAGKKPSDPHIRKALTWVRNHQDSKDGSWHAISMNKRYEPGSMQERFMSDAATAYSVLALSESKKSESKRTESAKPVPLKPTSTKPKSTGTIEVSQ